MNQENEIIVHRDDAPQPLAPAPQPPRHGFDPPALNLSADQHEAIKMIIAGDEMQEIATKLKIERTTLWRWRKSDPNFIAALNQWRGEMVTETRDQVLGLGKKAKDAVAGAIAEKNARIGLTLLGKLNCLTPGPDQPVDPYAVFGIGAADESIRGPVMEKFRQLSVCMTEEQNTRAPQLLALGVAIDNLIANRPSSPDLLEMCGPLPALAPRVDVPTAYDLAAKTLPLPASEADQENHSSREKSVAPSVPLRVKARVVHASDEGASYARKRPVDRRE